MNRSNPPKTPLSLLSNRAQRIFDFIHGSQYLQSECDDDADSYFTETDPSYVDQNDVLRSTLREPLESTEGNINNSHYIGVFNIVGHLYSMCTPHEEKVKQFLKTYLRQE